MSDTGTAMIHVPASVDEMRQPKPTDVITEAANFLRAHWDEVVDFFKAISGEAPTIHGNVVYDEAACIFKIQAIANQNGYALLGNTQASKLRRAVRYAYKRNTGTPVHALESQNRRLRIEQRRTVTAA